MSLNESPHPKAGKFELPHRVARTFAVASMKVPTRRRGNSVSAYTDTLRLFRLNESPHPKAGKSRDAGGGWCRWLASMKVPTRRRGNNSTAQLSFRRPSLNESPHPKAGKLQPLRTRSTPTRGLNESPHPKAGKYPEIHPKIQGSRGLNESPHPKAGK